MSKRRKEKKNADVKQRNQVGIQQSGTEDLSILLKTLQDKFFNFDDYKGETKNTNNEELVSNMEVKDKEAEAEDIARDKESMIEVLTKEQVEGDLENFIELSHDNFQLWIEGQAKLPELFYEVKSMGNSIALEDCHISSEKHKLIINGYVKERLQYAAIDNLEDSMISGEMKEATISIPFKADYYIPIDYLDDIEQDKFYLAVKNYHVIDAEDDISKSKQKKAGRKNVFNKVKKNYVLSMNFSLLKNK